MQLRLRNLIWAVALLTTIAAHGCRSQRPFRFERKETPVAAPASYEVPAPPTPLVAGAAQPVPERPDEPARNQPPAPASVEPDRQIPELLAPPTTLLDPASAKPWSWSLEDAIRQCLLHSRVFRDVSGRILNDAQSITTVYDPALQITDPRIGVARALSDFDARFGVELWTGRRERTINNLLRAGGTREFRQQHGTFRAGLWKRTATGAELSLTSDTLYDRNNSPTNLFHSAWTTDLFAGFRQPLLRGAGLDVNRIAGPDAQPGRFRGVAVARLDQQIELTRFEQAVRDLVRDVEWSYWELYFAYRRLDAKQTARDAALETWRLVESRMRNGEADGEQEALARERFFAAQAEVENALNGSPVGSPSRVSNPDRLAGHAAGVYALERQLRYLCGLPAADGRLIRPADEPTLAALQFDWYDSVAQSFSRRIELRKQRNRVRRKELELVAARNQRQMQLDLHGQYGLIGFGDQFFGTAGAPNDSAFHDLVQGRLNNWHVGGTASAPVGNRLGHATARNAVLALTRAREIEAEQARRVEHELAMAIAELHRSYKVSQTQLNRRIAARQRLDAVQAKYAGGNALLEFVLQSQQTAADADNDFFRALADYNQAIASVHLARGTYLEYAGVILTDGDEPRAVARRHFRHRSPLSLDYRLPRRSSAPKSVRIAAARPLAVARLLHPVAAPASAAGSPRSDSKSAPDSATPSAPFTTSPRRGSGWSARPPRQWKVRQ